MSKRKRIKLKLVVLNAILFFLWHDIRKKCSLRGRKYRFPGLNPYFSLFTSDIVSFTWDVTLNNMGYNPNYMESIFDYIGYNQKEQEYNPKFRFFHPDFRHITLLFPLDCSRKDPIRFCDFDGFVVNLLTGVRKCPVCNEKNGKKISKSVCMLTKPPCVTS